MNIALETSLTDLTEDNKNLLFNRQPGEARELSDIVSNLIDRVRDSGDAALLEMVRDLDQVELDTLEVPKSELERAAKTIPGDLKDALERAAANIRAFHRAQIPRELKMEVEPGVKVARCFVPLDRVGVYAPGGRAAYPSSVLMGVVPARAVGVREVVLCSPAGPIGTPPIAVMAAAHIAGVDRMFAVGGAGAIAALTYGTESIEPVDAIVGPGNRWVTEAKRQVAGRVVIDSLAGPSEVLVVVDGTTNPEWAALELIAQAEHDPEACAVLLAETEEQAKAVRNALEPLVEQSPRKVIVDAALANQASLIWGGSREDRIDFIQRYAPEHLALMLTDAKSWLPHLTTSGTIFLGSQTSVAFGDYLTGGNHVLPTGGLAKNFSGLSAVDFMRSFTYQEVTHSAAARLGPVVGLLADEERLPGHAAAARARAEGPPSS